MRRRHVPAEIHAGLFDLDGVLTRTAPLHAEAWKETFDRFLRRHAAATHTPFEPFDPVTDYRRHVDGRLRADGIRAFLSSRGIVLPEGGADDPPGAPTVAGLGRAKNDLVVQRIRAGAVELCTGARRFVEAFRASGRATALVSSSTNARTVLEATGLGEDFDAVVDGEVARAAHLAGKPAPDTYLHGARAVGTPPAQAAVFEDAIAGVQAGRSGGFGWVVGIGRGRAARALRRHGAHLTVPDLGELRA